MSRFLFLSLPAHGHVNPMLPVARELVRRGHAVRFVLTEEFRAKVEAAGAEHVPLEPFMPPAPKGLEQRVGRDFALLVEMAADTALAMEGFWAEEVASRRPDAVVSDSLCLWGKLPAARCGLPLVISTPSLAFNEASARYMKAGPGEALRTLAAMPRLSRAAGKLRAGGYPAESFIGLIENRSDVDTLVYTTRRFQPMAETFGANFSFVGPCVDRSHSPRGGRARPHVYVSLGTVFRKPKLLRACAEGLSSLGCDVTLSAGSEAAVGALGVLPGNCRAFARVDQLSVLETADAFVTHCGMNSVSEALFLGVPLVLLPQHSEEGAVARRVAELGAGVRPRRETAADIRDAALALFRDGAYREAAARCREDFLASGGAIEAATAVERASKI